MATKDIDKGFRKILKEIRTLHSKPHVKVGIIGLKKHKKSKKATVVKIATTHEFGSKKRNIPQRSFMRTTFDEQKNAWFSQTKRLKSQVLSGRMTVSNSLDILGLTLETAIRSKIQKQDPKWPALSLQTIKRKKSTKKLIDNGQLKNSLRYVKVIKK